MKKSIKIKCPAKVNLTLDVVSRRDDGYHNLEMIMHTIRLFDIINISFDSSQVTEILVTSNSHILPTDDRNLCAKAARLFLEAAGLSAEISISIKKNIPIGAGLGGGSSDAAGTLLALNKLAGNVVPVPTLCDLAKKLGADVPFFLYGGCMLAEGIGENLTPIPTLENAVFLIAKPNYGISTAGVYKRLSLTADTIHPDTKEAVSAIKKGDLYTLGKVSGNVLETAVVDQHPEIEQYKKIMKENGAVYSLMSGSGSSVFGVFDDADKAAKAAKELKKLTHQVFLA